MSFSFPTVPSNIAVPGVYPQVTLTTTGLTPVNDQVLIVAQCSTSGSALDGQVVPIFDEADAILYCGKGSPAHLAATEALIANPNVSLYVLCIADNITNADSTATFNVPNNIDVATTGTVYIDDVSIPFSISANDAASDAQLTIATTINSYSGQIPCNASLGSETGTVNFNVHGAIGNNSRFAIVSDSTYFDSTSFNSGTGTVNLGDYLTAGTYAATLANGKWDIIVNALDDTSSVSAIDEILTFRASSTEQNPAVQIVAYNDKVLSSVSAATTFAGTIDSPRTSIAYLSYANQPVPTSAGFKLSAAFGAIIPESSGTTVNVPYDGLVLNEIVPPAVNDQFNGLAQQNMLTSGVTPLIVVPGQQVAICRAVDSYTDDERLMDTNTMRQIDYITDQIDTNLKANFQRVQLSNRTLKSIISNVANTTYQLDAAGIIQNSTTYAPAITAVADTTNVGRVNVTVPVELVVGLHVIVVNINVII